MVGVAGFEPAASCSQSRRADRTALYPEWSAFTNKYKRTEAVTAGFEPAIPR